MKLAVIVASTRNGRVGKRVSDWVVENIPENSGFEVELVDLADLNLPFFDESTLPAMATGIHKNTEVARWSEIIRSADAYLFVAPEYNHGLPAPLKNAIDWLYVEWGNKPASIVSYSGGIGGGIRAAEALRLVLAHLAVANVQMLVNIPKVEDSLFGQDASTQQSAKSALAGQIVQLKNWAKALKQLRSEISSTKK